MEASSLFWTDVKGGMNASDPPMLIATNQVAEMVNCRLENGLPTTRYGSRVTPITGSASEVFAGANLQGSIFFNPAKGQGGIVLAADNAQLVVAAGGSKYSVKLNGRKDNTTAALVDVTAGNVTSNQLHLAWMVQAEDRVVTQDGQSPAWIWDGMNPSRFSTGYNVANQEQSMIPNGGTVMVYAHSRLVTVVNAHFILVGDQLFATDQATASDVERTTQQTYWATGPSFIPPTSIGNIMAAEVMASPGETNDGTGNVWFHLEDGLFAINLNVFPRSSWSSTPMVKTALKIPGASGPYAVTVVNGDQIFLSTRGLMSIQWAMGQNTINNPISSFSEQVSLWLKADYRPWLRFASLNEWTKMQRLMVTTQPIVQGRYRWHRGFAVNNLLVTKTTVTPAAWEGLWTLHPQAAGVIQFVNGIFSSEERQFAWCRGTDDRNRLVEFCPHLRQDVKEDGTRLDIPCQVITRGMDAGAFWRKREYSKGRLYFRIIRGTIKWGVWLRSADCPEWIFWKAGTATNPITADSFHLVQNEPRPLVIPLGKLPALSTGASNAEARYVQALVRWCGFASLENLELSYGQKDLIDENVNPSNFSYTFTAANSRQYDAFEYTVSETPRWVSTAPSCS